MTRLGYFSEALAIDFHSIVAQIFGNVLDYIEIVTLGVLTAVATYWATFGNIWATFFQHLVALTTTKNKNLFTIICKLEVKLCVTFDF